MTHLVPDIYKDAPNKKLSPKWAGPYRIVKRIGNTAYELDLLSSTRVHPVFHVGIL